MRRDARPGADDGRRAARDPREGPGSGLGPRRRDDGARARRRRRRPAGVPAGQGPLQDGRPPELRADLAEGRSHRVLRSSLADRRRRHGGRRRSLRTDDDARRAVQLRAGPGVVARRPEVWFTASRALARELFAVEPFRKAASHRRRSRQPHAARHLEIRTRARDARSRAHLRARRRAPATRRDRDLSWLNWTLAIDLSDDGKTALLEEEGGDAYMVGPAADRWVADRAPESRKRRRTVSTTGSGRSSSPSREQARRRRADRPRPADSARRPRTCAD